MSRPICTHSNERVHWSAMSETWREKITKENVMAKCDTCGNEYDKSFQLIASGRTYTFDSFECAIHKLAPVCSHCGCKIVGHGVEANGTFYCCANCARHEGATGAVDNVSS
jgi:hypothetical protein